MLIELAILTGVNMAFGSLGNLYLNQTGDLATAPQGPSAPGYVQGSASTIRDPNFIGPVKPVTAPTYNQPTTNPLPTGGYSGGGGTLSGVNNQQSLADQQLRELQSAYDYNAEQARNQLSALGSQYNQAVDEANTGFQNVASQIGKTKEQNLSEIDRQIQAAGSTAKQTQMKNRNVLRGLGILNSSYAGESLQRPMEQFAMQRNDLMTAATKRGQELDDILTQKTSEHQNMLAGLRNNYDNLVNQIQTDLRFNDRQRADAIRAVNLALTQNIANIQSQQQQIAAQVAAQKQNLANVLSGVNAYQNPQANLSNISATLEQPGSTQPQTQQANIYSAYDPRKYLSQLFQ